MARGVDVAAACCASNGFEALDNGTLERLVSAVVDVGGHAALGAAACACRALRAAAEGGGAWRSACLAAFGAAGGAEDATVEHRRRLRCLAACRRGSWEAKDAAAPPRRNGGAGAAFASCAVLFGGNARRVSRVSVGLLADLWELDVASGVWAEAAVRDGAGPEPRWGHSAVAVAAGLAVVSGGFVEGAVTDELWLLERVDRCAYRWERIQTEGAAVGARAFHSGTLVFGRWLVLAGGLASDGSRSDLVVLDTAVLREPPPQGRQRPPVPAEAFDFEADLAELARPGRAGHVAGFVESRQGGGGVGWLLLGGGCTRGNSSDSYLGHVVALQAHGGRPGEGRLRFGDGSVAPSMLQFPPRTRCAVHQFLGDHLLCWGGFRPDGRFDSNVWALHADGAEHAVTWQWHRVRMRPGRAPTPREGAVSFVVPGGVLIVGGADFSPTSDMLTQWLLRMDGAEDVHPSAGDHDPWSASSDDSDGGFGSDAEEGDVDEDDDDGTATEYDAIAGVHSSDDSSDDSDDMGE